jgi:5-methylthioadenosine/S-adenosylhomocysteine deaminase
MADILITNGIVVTMDPERRVIHDGAVAIEKDRIVAVGSTAEVKAQHRADKVIDARRKLVMPGIIDAHGHAGHALVKTMGNSDFAAWSNACGIIYTVGSDEQYWRAEARLTALERLRFGVTTGLSLLGGGDSVMRTDDTIYPDAHCSAVLEVGTRSVVAIGPTRPPHPQKYVKWSNGGSQEKQVTSADQIAVCEATVKKWHRTHSGRIHIALLTPTTRQEHVDSLGQNVLDDIFAQAKTMLEMSHKYGTIFTQDGHSRNTIARFHDHVGMTSNCLFSHSVDLTDREMALCLEHDAKIAHNPSAVASINGRCPAVEMMEMGVTVALGSDGTAPDRSSDMFRHMQQCMHYHRRHFRDSHILSPGKVLEMCTIDGATALGLADEIGSLEVGKKADVTLLDLARPHLYPLNMEVIHAVCFANGNDVATVVIDGKICMEDRKVLTVNEEEILDEAQQATDKMLERTGLAYMLETPDNFWKTVRYS